jgi:uncharacterized protein (TIGR03435 family)
MVTVTAYTVRDLIADSYDVRAFRVEGATGWVAADRFDIAARVTGETAPTTDQVRVMLQTLLAERFGLKLHRETREMSVYALVMAKSGPKLKKTSSSGSMMRRGSEGQDIRLTFTGSPLDMLAQQLSTIPGVGRPVVDKTGIEGRHDFELQLAAPPQSAVTGPSGESLFTAIEEQLGLKLESQKEPIEILVIDSVARPSEN